MRSFLVASCISASALASACGFFAPSNTPPPTSSNDDDKAGSAATSEAGAKPVDLVAYALPLTIDLPAGADLVSAGDDVHVKITVGDSEVHVGPAHEEADTITKAKAYYAKDAPAEYVKEEASLLVWKIGGGQRGFLVLAEAQGKTYACEGSGSTAGIAPAITRCKSLKPAAAGGEATKTEGKKADAKKGPPKPVSLATYEVPLSIDLPPDAEINDLGDEVTISVGESLLRVGLAAPGEATIASAKATQDQSFASEYLKQEADLLVWKRDDKESAFLVLAKRAGKTYACKGVAPNASVETEIARCKSLAPAK